MRTFYSTTVWRQLDVQQSGESNLAFGHLPQSIRGKDGAERKIHQCKSLPMDHSNISIYDN